LACLWGGFRPNVQKELARDFFRVRFWSRKELLKKLFSHYDQLPEEIRLSLPLKRVWMVAEPDDTLLELNELAMGRL
jgi:restriction system protein